MKLKDAKKILDVINDYFENEGYLSFDIANKLCDVIPKLEEQVAKYDKLFVKWVKEYYNPVEQKKEGDPSHKLKDITQIEFVLNERDKIDNLEFFIEKETMPKMETISPKVLRVLKEFFIFE